jgi:hypothetical protein
VPDACPGQAPSLGKSPVIALLVAVLKPLGEGKGRGVEKCRHPGRLAALPSGRLPPGGAVVVECGDDDRDDQPGQFVIHRVLDAQVAAAQQGPFHCADSTGRDVGGSYRERVMRLDLPARRYWRIRKPSQMRVLLGVMLTPFNGAGVAALCVLPCCYDACSLVSVHGPRMPCPDSGVRFRSYWLPGLRRRSTVDSRWLARWQVRY